VVGVKTIAKLVIENIIASVSACESSSSEIRLGERGALSLLFPRQPVPIGDNHRPALRGCRIGGKATRLAHRARAGNRSMRLCRRIKLASSLIIHQSACINNAALLAKWLIASSAAGA